jgi:type II secretory ATPase GspE/PulE/Tfp pilus assembly ATPase PilB-like protein
MPHLDTSKALAEWGFASEAPFALKAHAQLCLEHARERVGDIVVARALATREQVERAVEAKPANVLTLEHLAQNLPGLREHALRVLAISRGLAYLEVIDERWSAAGAQLPASARARLDEMGAAFLSTPDARPMVVFSDLGALLAFSQMGQLERASCPVRQGIAAEPLVALAAPAAVARAASAQAQSADLRVVGASAQDNFWSSSQARTDAERVLARLLDEALSRRATDVEVAPLRDGTARVRLRIYGDMAAPERHALLTPEFSREIVNFLISRSRAGDGGRLRRPADGQITYKNASSETFIRCSFIPADRFGLDFDMVSVSLRLMPRSARNITLSELNLSPRVAEQVHKALVRTQGLIVLAGPTNSGKSTTIAGVVGEHLAMFGASRKRLSLEDPVERYLEGITQISVENNFAELMRALLRHDPDLVWVGEIRDAFSAAACVRASTSGHVVLSTVHANNSILAFRAIANYLRPDTGEASGAGASLFDLAESLSLLIGQRLVKRLCPHCRVPQAASESETALVCAYLEDEGQAHLVPRAQSVLRTGVHRARAGGCAQCNHCGYAGELPVNELLPATREVREIFSRSQTHLDYTALSQHRLCTLAESALELVERGDAEVSALFI